MAVPWAVSTAPGTAALSTICPPAVGGLVPMPAVSTVPAGGPCRDRTRYPNRAMSVAPQHTSREPAARVRAAARSRRTMMPSAVATRMLVEVMEIT